MQGIFRLSKAEFLKLFRSKKATWKNASKCSAVLVVLDFRKLSDGKKQTIVLPFRKKKELQDAFKELKKLPSEQKLPLKKVAACSYELLDEETARFTILKGGADAASCQAELQKLFTRLQIKVLISGAGESAEPEKEAEGDSLDAPAQPLMQELLAQANRLKAQITGFSQLTKIQKQEKRNFLLQAIRNFETKAENQEELPPKMQGFLTQVQTLALKIKPSTSTENDTEKQETKRAYQFEQLEKWIRALEKTPTLLAVLEPKIAQLITELKKQNA